MSLQIDRSASPPMALPSTIACILQDPGDRSVIQRHIPATGPSPVFVPLSYEAILIAVLENKREGYLMGETTLPDDEGTATLDIFRRSQGFLSSLFGANPRTGVAGGTGHYPGEYYWFCIFAALRRLAAAGRAIVTAGGIRSVYMVNRSKRIDISGIVVYTDAFVRFLREYLQHHGLTVHILTDVSTDEPPVVEQLYPRSTWRIVGRRLLRLAAWKWRSRSRRNDRFILVDPSYENTIHFKGPLACRPRAYPQVYYDSGLPFFHSWRSILAFGLARLRPKKLPSMAPVYPPHTDTIDGMSFDISDLFRETVSQYLQRVGRVKARVDQWWVLCPNRALLGAIVFSLSPVFLDSFFLIRKIRANGGKVIVWQHGGFYGYAEHPVYRITDYRRSDLFLCYGRRHSPTSGDDSDNPGRIDIPVGSHRMYHRPSGHAASVISDAATSPGVYIPAVIGSLISQSRIDWDPVRQFETVKAIIDMMSSGRWGPVTVKGLKKHKYHRIIGGYIRAKGSPHIAFEETDIATALDRNPAFVLLDAPSTPLLEILASCRQPVMLINCQSSWRIHPDALALLKKRVWYSESIENLKDHLCMVHRGDAPQGPSTDNTAFLDAYAPPFSASAAAAVFEPYGW